MSDGVKLRLPKNKKGASQSCAPLAVLKGAYQLQRKVSDLFRCGDREQRFLIWILGFVLSFVEHNHCTGAPML